MLGKTNLILKEAEPAGDVAILQELVQTYYPNIHVIGVANGKIFTIKDNTYGKEDNTVLYSDDLEHLTETSIKAKQVLYANETYYFLYYTVSSDSGENGLILIYSSKDLKNFQELIISNQKYNPGLNMLYHNKDDGKVYLVCTMLRNIFEVEYDVLRSSAIDGKVTILQEHKITLLDVDSVQFYIKSVEIFENKVLHFTWTDASSDSNRNNGLSYPTDTNYIFVKNSIDGYIKGYYWYATRSAIYRSINGTDFKLVCNISNKSIKIMDYHGNILVIVRTGNGATEAENDSISFAVASKWENVDTAMSHRVTFTPQYFINDIFLVNDVFYAAGNAGLFIKAYFGEEPEEQPADEILIKTLAAREALEKANRYTDEKYALLEARLTALEEQVLPS